MNTDHGTVQKYRAIQSDIKKILPLLVIVFCCVISVSAGKKSPFLFVVNPGVSSNESPWRAVIEQEKIYDWGRTHDLYLVSDRGPVIDGRAGYPLTQGSVVALKSPGGSGSCWLWIDFVTFTGKGDGEFFSPLTMTMTATAENGNTVYVKKIHPRDCDPRSVFKMKLPYDLTVGSVFTIEFREDAPRYGGWALWDIIVTDSRILPEKIDRAAGKNKDMEINSELLK